MTLLRAAARTMLASYFVASGYQAVRNPEPLVPAAEPITDKVVPLLKQYAPEQVSSYIPEDTVTLVRVNGAVQIVGGLALASGRGRRLGALLLAGSLIPSTLAKHPFWSKTDAAEKADERHQFLKNVSLLGGVLLAAGDTEGKPSLAWRAQKGGELIAKKTSKTSHKLAKQADSLTSSITDGGSDFADHALAGGAALLGTVVATSRKARKEATKQFQQAQIAAAKQAKVTRKAAEEAAKKAKKEAPKRLKAAKKFAAEQAKEAQAAALQAGKDARKAAAQARKDAPKQAKAAKAEAQARAKLLAKQAKKFGENIQLGDN